MQGIFSAINFKPKLDILTRAIGQASHHASFRQDYTFLYTKCLSRISRFQSSNFNIVDMSRKHLQNITGLRRNIESSPQVVNALIMWAPSVSTMSRRVINQQLRLKHTEGTWICCAARHRPSQIGSIGVWLKIPENNLLSAQETCIFCGSSENLQ